MDGELAIDLILQSLPDSFSQFIMNFNMNKMECSLAELLKMLNTAETCIKKPKDVMAIEGPSTKKGKKKKFQPKAKGGIKKGKANKPNDKGKCFHCGKDGHWKRNCKTYLNSLKVKPKENPSEGKMTRAPFVGRSTRATDLLELIHTDVCGPFNEMARGGYYYFITFIDDHSRYSSVYLMKYKSEAFEKFKEYRNEVEKQTGKAIKTLRSDRGTPELNGVSERRNRTLLDMVRAMVSYTDLPISLWGYALLTATYVLNRVPSKSVPKIPYEMWYGKQPSLNHLRIWGCPAFIKRLKSEKLEAKADSGRFIGYPKETLGYYFYIQSDQRVLVSRNAIFLEKEFIQEGGQGRKLEFIENSNEDKSNEELVQVQTQGTQQLRRSSRIIHPPERYGFLHQMNDIFLLGDTDHRDDPTSYEEAILDIDSKKWLEAMDLEMDSMRTNQVWTLVDPPEGIIPIRCKWIFKRKIGLDGKVETYKARLVAKGYRQIQGIDYEETFSPVAMLKSIRILLAIAAYYDYEIWQMDVKTAFLNGYIEEDIYMIQPCGFESKTNPHKVCKLRKSIYGLKRASRSWNIRFDDAIKSFGFIKNEDEPCVYKKVSGSAITFLVLYVDDILLIVNDIGQMSSVKIWLSQNFSMKDLGDAMYILGIRIYRDRSRRLIGLCQAKYIEKILKKFNMWDSKRGFIPFRHGIHLSKSMSPKTYDERERMNKIPYASAIGSLMYAMLCTRPDIAHGVSVTSIYQSNPGEEHWTAVKNIFKYLRRTKDLFLTYGEDSTTEAEYIAASDAAKEAVWIRKFIQQLGVVPTIALPISLYCDNNGAIAQAKELRSHQKSKHIERRYHIIREIIGRSDITMQKVASADNTADPLTKALTQQQLDRHLEKMGMRYHSDWL
ncbi:hypothetical protein KPL71_014867 [Citrus sinensis]|uniref:Uncharacterized protein n=1 Tax=Citrus sinensis TaxID=2711 RepID=A0ACB8KEP5_CITSI|nr:hypothetical protein KPL71_014867 [Citrus sinensis]